MDALRVYGHMDTESTGLITVALGSARSLPGRQLLEAWHNRFKSERRNVGPSRDQGQVGGRLGLLSFLSRNREGSV